MDPFWNRHDQNISKWGTLGRNKHELLGRLGRLGLLGPSTGKSVILVWCLANPAGEAGEEIADRSSDTCTVEGEHPKARPPTIDSNPHHMKHEVSSGPS